MKNTSHLGFWILAALVTIFVMPMLTSADHIRSRLIVESRAVEDTFGPNLAGFILRTTNGVYEAFSASGAKSAVSRTIHSEKQAQEAEKYMSVVGRAFAEGGSSYMQGVLMQIYAVVMRGLIVLIWTLLLLPFLAAAIVDGLSLRAVKYASFGYQNPTAFSLGAHAVILISVLPLAYIVMPLHMTPLFMPVWALCAAVPMLLAISHAQPIFTK